MLPGRYTVLARLWPVPNQPRQEQHHDDADAELENKLVIHD
jgi:hypothetical protein